jgi:elongation factor P
MNISEIKTGTAIIINNELFSVIDCEHAKLGRGSAFLRTKLKKMSTGKIIERTLRDSDKIETAFIEKKKVQFLYKEPPFYHFMDLDTYESFPLEEEKIQDITLWLKENLELEGLFHNGTLINLELPGSLNLKVIQTDPGLRGDTVKQGTKPAKLETGAVIQVPLFISQGEAVRVNPQTQEYLGRA